MPNAADGAAMGAENKCAVLVPVLTMTFMSTLDSSIVNVALPAMQRGLGAGLDQIQWVASVYLVAICATLLVFGRLGDLLGKARLFQAGVAVFSAGSLLCGLSHTFGMLMAARVLQGIGASATMANNMGIITESFPARELGRALGLLASFVALGMMCGPVLGGVIVSSLPWELIFLINVPVGVFSLLAGFKTLPLTRPDRTGERFDMAGAVLLVPGTALALCSVALIERGVSWQLAVLLAAGAALLAGFVAVERRAAHPLAQLSVFRSALFDLNLGATFIGFVAVGATEIVLPFYFQDARGFDPTLSGLLFAVIPLVNVAVGLLSGGISDRIGCYVPTTVGMGVYAVGTFCVGMLGEGSGIAAIVCAVALMSLGTSTFQSPNNSLVMGSAPDGALGFVGSVQGLAQNMGMAVGISGGMALLYGGMSAAAGERVTAYVAGRPDIFFTGYRLSYLVTAAIVAVGFAIAAVRWAMARRSARRG